MPRQGAGLAVPLLDHVGRSLGKHVELLGKLVTLIGPPIKLLGKVPVERGKVDSVSLLRALALFNRASPVIVGIVRHGGKNELNSTWVR